MNTVIDYPVNELRKACQEMAVKVQPDYFVTLTFRSNEVGEEFARNILRKYLHRVNRELFGRHSKEKLYLLVVQEKNQSNGIHYHLLIRDPSEQTKRTQAQDLRAVLKKHWQKMPYNGYEMFSPTADKLFKPDDETGAYVPSEKEWFKPIDDIDGILEYITKQIPSRNSDAIDWELSNF